MHISRTSSCGSRSRLAGVIAPVAAALAIAVVAASCSTSSGTDGNQAAGSTSTTAAEGKKATLGPQDDTSPPVRGGQLVFGLEAEPDGLDPSRSRFAGSGHMMASAVFDPLATLDAGGKTVPYLAKSFDPSPDFREWTIVLPEGVTFHDGSPLNADALIVNLDYWTKSFITSLALTSLESYAKVDEQRVKLKMNQPWSSFPYAMTTQVGYIAAPSFLNNPDPTGPSMKPIGTGPFKFKEYLKGESFTADRNPDYWQKNLPYLDQIRFKFIADSNARIEQLTNQDIDVMHAYQPTAVLKMREEAAAGKAKLVENSQGEEDFEVLNTEKAPFDELTARQAIAHATDAAAWRALDKGVPIPATNPFAPGQLGYTTDDAYPGHDLEKAKAKAAEYKAKTGKDIEFTLYVTGNLDDTAEGQLLADQWAQAGIKANLETLDQSTLIAKVVLGDYQMADWRNYSAPDPDGDYLWWHSKSVTPPPKISPNVSRLKDPEIDAALDRARGSTDEAQRNQDYQTVARRLNEQVAVLWLGRVVWIVAANPEVQGIYAANNGTGGNLGAKTWLAQLWIKR